MPRCTRLFLKEINRKNCANRQKLKEIPKGGEDNNSCSFSWIAQNLNVAESMIHYQKLEFFCVSATLSENQMVP